MKYSNIIRLLPLIAVFIGIVSISYRVVFNRCEIHQVVVVIVSEENATLFFYEKDMLGEWEEVLRTPAIIGKNGVGKSQEGDGKTPLGIYSFIKAFGILEDPGCKMQYIQVDESHHWIDDEKSKYYNQFVSIRDIEMDWESAEHICEYEEAYHYVLATSYNEENIPGKGSAVFLHCTSEDMEHTAGCIAIPGQCMQEIMKRVDKECKLIIDVVY